MTKFSSDQLIARLNCAARSQINSSPAYTVLKKHGYVTGLFIAQHFYLSRLFATMRDDCSGKDSQFPTMKTSNGCRTRHGYVGDRCVLLLRAFSATVFDVLSQFRYHGMATFEKRFSRGTQRVMSLLEIAFCLTGACGAYKYFASIISSLFGILDLSSVSMAGFTVFGLLHMMTLGLVFTVGLIISNALFIGLMRVVYPLGTGRGRARLDRHYFNLIEGINREQCKPIKFKISNVCSDQTLMDGDVNDYISDVIERFGLRRDNVSGFSNTILLLKKTNSKANQAWLLDNMINAIRDFKNGIKIMLSYPNVDYAMRDQAAEVYLKLVGLVRYMKNRETIQYSYDQIESLYGNVAIFLADKRLTQFPYDLNDVTKCALGLAFKTLLQLELLTNNKRHAHCDDIFACGGCCHDETFSTAMISKAPLHSVTFSSDRSNRDSVIANSPGLTQCEGIAAHCAQDQYGKNSHVAVRSCHYETLPVAEACTPSVDDDALCNGLSEPSIGHHANFIKDAQSSYLRPPFDLCQECGSPNSICAINNLNK